MGRRKLYHKRYLIGLGTLQANTLEAMASGTALTYSEVVSYLIDYYQLGLNEEKVKKC